MHDQIAGVLHPVSQEFRFGKHLRILASLGLLSCLIVMSESCSQGQLYRSSITATEFDFITEDDPSAFSTLEFQMSERSEMPDKRDGKNDLFKNAFVFQAEFTDGTNVRILVDDAFENKEAAETEAMRYVHRLGKLPTILRSGVNRLVVHHGGQDTSAFSDQGLIVLYADNATKRISTHDLEETIFHESVHAALDQAHANSERWKRAQATDNAFLTVYGQGKPEREDLAESALFAYTLLHHPERIPEEESRKIKATIPNRILYVAELLPPDQPVFQAVTESAGAIWDSETEKVRCDIRKPGIFADLLSTTLLTQFDANENQVKKITADAEDRYQSGEELFLAAIAAFEIDASELKQALKDNLHCNCKHDGGDDQLAKELIESWKDNELRCTCREW